MKIKALKGICAILICSVFCMFSLAVSLNSDVTGGESVQTVVYKSGSTGTTVKNIQTKLKNLGYYTGAIDGIFGSKTKSAVVRFQSDYGLTVDGIVGTKTLSALGLSSSSSASSSDKYLLARCIYAEARGEPYVGQVAVGAVVLNRVKSSKFPNSIAGVIYQSYAFTSVADGQINLSPDSTALKAAEDALNGWDPTNGCLYYYNPSTATSSWIWSREIRLVIGNHNFCV